MAWYIIDIINFILLFLLMDFFNGFHKDCLGKRFRSSILAALFLLLIDFIVCFSASFWLAAKIVLSALLLTAIVLVITGRIRLNSYIRYADVEEGKEPFFAGQKVMLLVPHEDDDINLMGGVLEQYIKYGSEVYVVFSTNGDGDKRFDMTQMGYTRIKEAIRVLTFLGVPEKNIIFLGYCDGGWGKSGYHIYNAPENEVILSDSGRTQTYGIDSHPPYHENKSYTRSNLYSDIKQVIADHLPDTLFCIDYDTHNDHRALSMLFERVVGELVRSIDYKPKVYKAYAYRTSWRAAEDYYDSENLTSSVNSYVDRDVQLYEWDNRVRLSVDTGSIARYLNQSKLYKALSLYASQSASERAVRIINGDKVFWERETTSLLYSADISVSSGDKEKLTDFMLLDCDGLTDHGDYPYDGVWHPSDDDTEKMIRVVFDTERYIEDIVLYDNPSLKDNIRNATVETDDGMLLSTGKLKPSGTHVSIKRSIRSFTIRIEDYEGEKYGLTEIEAFSGSDDSIRPIFKIIDNQDNFVYDYIVAPEGRQMFGVYSNTDFRMQDCRIQCDNNRCKVRVCEDSFEVFCPRGQKCLLSLISDDKVLDTVLIRNPFRIVRFLFEYCRDKDIHKAYAHRVFHIFVNKLHS